jgi:DNA repair protein RecO (recombination protein O)
METTRAILLRKTKLTETSLIITWLTASHGRLKTVAKGARQPRNRFSGRLDLFFECDIQWSHSRKGELHTLREVEILDPHEAVRLDFLRVSLCSYFVELIELVTEAEHAVPDLYDLLNRALNYLNANSASRLALEHFERELARLLGIANPAVSSAVALGRAYQRVPSSRPELLRRLR